MFFKMLSEPRFGSDGIFASFYGDFPHQGGIRGESRFRRHCRSRLVRRRMSLSFGGREEKYARIAFNLIPKTFDQVADAADFCAARAQGDEEGEAEADAEVDQADGEDAENAEYECTKADVAADGGIAEVGGGKGDVADVQRQPEEVSEIAGHTQEHSEDEVADQRAVVFVDVGGEDAAGPGRMILRSKGLKGRRWRRLR